MKTPKRRAPEKKPAPPASGPVLRAGAALFGLAAARPGPTGGVLVFTIVFGMISANALWYQHGGHPSPLLRTRDTADRHLLVGFERSDEPANVTTFRIERPEPEPAAAPAGVAEAVQGAALELNRAIQQELARLGLYQGAADGLAGPRTSAAIADFQRKAGLPATGEASDSLLAALRAASPPSAAIAAPKTPERQAAAQPAVVPAQRPTPLPALSSAADPVAEAIRKAEKLTPPAPIPAVSRAVPQAAADPRLVSQIQRGLSKFAYSHITVDGVAGASTRDAIRNFEKAYRLPETGEPNERVLKKLKEIGAL